MVERFFISGGIAILFAMGSLHAQDTTNTWALNASILTMLYRDTDDLVMPTVTADHRDLHLEVRYNWEDYRTASAWVGHWFRFGDELRMELAPMAGIVFGQSNGAAPGYQFEASWKSLSLSSTSEYYIDFEDNTSNFFYTWTEMSVDLNFLLTGIVVQRTRTFESPLDVQSGLLVMREQGSFTFGLYVFNPFQTDPTVGINLSYDLELPRRPK